jgi:hypothetical protein
MFPRSSMKGHMYTYDASPATPGRHVRFGTSTGETRGFPGSPLQNLADAMAQIAAEAKANCHEMGWSCQECLMSNEDFLKEAHPPRRPLPRPAASREAGSTRPLPVWGGRSPSDSEPDVGGVEPLLGPPSLSVPPRVVVTAVGTE